MESYNKYADFFEGRMSDHDECRLFADLQYDDEMRKGFRRFFAVEQTMRKTAGMYVPPPDITAKIYAGVGLSATEFSGSSIHSAGKSEHGTKGIFGGKFFSSFVTGLLSAGIAVVCTLLFAGKDELPNNDLHALSANANDQPMQSGDPIRDNNADASKAVSIYSKGEYKTSRMKSLGFEPITAYPTDAAVNEPETERSPAILKDKIAETAPERPAFAKLDNSIRYSADNHSLSAQNGTNIYRSPSLLGLSLEFCNNLTRFNTDPIVTPSKENPLKNCELSVGYNISDKFAVIAKVRCETFYVIYTGREGTDNFRYYRQPNLTTYGLKFKYSPIGSRGDFKPYLGIECGINTIGLVSTASAGTDFGLTERVYLTAGLFGSRFYYKHQSSSFTSDKYGLTFGIGVGL